MMSPVSQDMFALDASMLNSPAAQRALQVGLLRAKRDALDRTEHLIKLGRPLLVAIIFVSFLHVLESIAVIRPAWVPELRLWSSLYHVSAGALTLGIDLAALYVVSSAGAVAFAGGTPRRWAHWFFLLATFALNAAFVVRYAPALPAEVRAVALPALEICFVLLLPAIIPVAILSIEQAVSQLEAGRLKLVVEVTALEELTTTKPQKAAQGVMGTVEEARVLGEGRAQSPGRPGEYDLPQLLDLLAPGSSLRRADIIEGLGCGASTADRLIAAGLDGGALERAGRGVYRRMS